MRSQKMSFGKKAVLLSLTGVCALVFLLFNQQKQERATASDGSLVFFCAAGIKPPVEAAARRYQEECDIAVQIQYGGSGTLLSNIRVASRGDLYLAADNSYMDIARDYGLVAETIPLARMRPVIAVRKGNPKAIAAIDDLMRDDVAAAIANPDAAAIGNVTRKVLVEKKLWLEFKNKLKVLKPTVTDIANDIRLGAIDAGIIWDATAAQYPDLEAIHDPAFGDVEQTITVGILTASRNPADALRFARYLGAPDKGLREFERFGYRSAPGDAWEESPRLILFSGAVNRPAIEDTINAFEKREGVKVERVYNGCGILVSQIKAGQLPDAYFACDVSFMTQVRDLFAEVTDVSETDMVILAPKGNPANIVSLADLGRPGIKVGVANQEQSALGALTRDLLKEMGLYETIMKNVQTQMPTADLLVNQMRAGSLDAVIVYEANTTRVREHLDIVRIAHSKARAVQPIAISANSSHKLLAGRLISAIVSASSREKFEASGFNWRAAD